MYSQKMQMHWHLTSNQLILIMKVFTKHKILPDRKSSKHVHTHPCLYTYPVYIMRDDWWLYTWVHIPCGQAVNEGWPVTVHMSTHTLWPVSQWGMTGDCTQEYTIPHGQAVNEAWPVTVHMSTPYPVARQSMRDDWCLYTGMEALVTND